MYSQKDKPSEGMQKGELTKHQLPSALYEELKRHGEILRNVKGHMISDLFDLDYEGVISRIGNGAYVFVFGSASPYFIRPSNPEVLLIDKISWERVISEGKKIGVESWPENMPLTKEGMANLNQSQINITICRGGIPASCQMISSWEELQNKRRIEIPKEFIVTKPKNPVELRGIHGVRVPFSGGPEHKERRGVRYKKEVVAYLADSILLKLSPL